MIFLLNFIFVFADNQINSLPESILKSRENWVNSFNFSRENIKLHYYKNSFIIILEEESNLLLKNKDIEKYYMAILQKNKIINQEIIYSVKYDAIKYIEISKFEIDNGESLFSIREWEMQKNKWNINFEVIAKSNKESSKIDTDKLKELSDYWLKIANSGNIKFLCDEIYGENGYYIDWEINKGKEDIYNKFKEYMENNEYYIKFKETAFFSITENVGVEIGKYETPFGPGNFILIWKKDNFGKWYAAVDKG